METSRTPESDDGCGGTASEGKVARFAAESRQLMPQTEWKITALQGNTHGFI